MLRLVALVGAFCCAALAATIAHAAPYPERTVRIVVPYPPGGSTDGLARLIGQKLSEAWGQPVVIENRPGADTQIGDAAVAQAAPDGYTLLMITTTFAISKGLYPSLPYDAAKDFTPISPIASSPFYLVVGTDVPAKNLAELIALAKKNPGKLNYSVSSSANYLAAELMKKAAGIEVMDIRYKGSGPAVQAVAAGEVTYTLDTLLATKGLIDAGKLRVLALTGDRRSTQIPSVPLFSEAGLATFEMISWFGMGGPKGMPKDVVNTINAAVQKALALPEVKQAIDGYAATPMLMSADEYAAFIGKEF